VLKEPQVMDVRCKSRWPACAVTNAPDYKTRLSAQNAWR